MRLDGLLSDAEFAMERDVIAFLRWAAFEAKDDPRITRLVVAANVLWQDIKTAREALKGGGK